MFACVLLHQIKPSFFSERIPPKGHKRQNFDYLSLYSGRSPLPAGTQFVKDAWPSTWNSLMRDNPKPSYVPPVRNDTKQSNYDEPTRKTTLIPFETKRNDSNLLVSFRPFRIGIVFGEQGCQRRLPLVLPEVSIIDHTLLGKGFPKVYQDRLHDDEGKRGMVTEVWYI